MAVLISLAPWSHLLNCLHWPFCPGVSIAIMAFIAAFTAFWKDPPLKAKALLTVLFFGLMIVEISMIGIDRDNHDKSDAEAREAQQRQDSELDFLIVKSSEANHRLDEIDRQMAAAKGNPELIAALQKQADAARAQVKTASNQLLISMAQPIIQQMRHKTWVFMRDGVSIQDNATYAAPRDIPARRKAAEAKESQLTDQYHRDMMNLLTSADYLRQQMLQGQTLTPEDEKEALLFRAALQGDFGSFDGDDAARYLDALVKRISPQLH